MRARRTRLQVEPSFARQPGIWQKRDVGDAQRLADEIGFTGDQLLHRVKRLFAAFDHPRLTLARRLAEIEHLEARHRDIGLVAVLLPEQQLVDLGARERVGGNEPRVARQIEQDRVGLREAPTVGEFDDRNLPERIEGEKLAACASRPS